MRFMTIGALLACNAIRIAEAANNTVAADSINMPVIAQSEQCNEAFTQAVMPLWPKNALRAGTNGWAIVRFDLDGSGRAQNIEIVASAPQQVFDKASQDNIKRSTFKPGFIKTACRTSFVYTLTSSN